MVSAKTFPDDEMMEKRYFLGNCPKCHKVLLIDSPDIEDTRYYICPSCQKCLSYGNDFILFSFFHLFYFPWITFDCVFSFISFFSFFSFFSPIRKKKKPIWKVANVYLLCWMSCKHFFTTKGK